MRWSITSALDREKAMAETRLSNRALAALRWLNDGHWHQEKDWPVDVRITDVHGLLDAGLVDDEAGGWGWRITPAGLAALAAAEAEVAPCPDS